jgi:pimeloyl-ACP methyl ester carboxylesterase
MKNIEGRASLSTARALVGPSPDPKFIVQHKNGMKLSTVDSGPRTGKENALLFLHGWTCDGASFHAQLEQFDNHRRVIVPDLRGHGSSDASVRHYGLADFVDDLRWQLDDLDVDHAIVVGHSMGGNIGLELAIRDQGRISGVLMIDSLVFPGREVSAGLKVVGDLLEVSGLDAALAEVAALLFIAEDDGDVSAEILRRMAMTPHHVAAPAFRAHVMDYDPTIALASCTVPLGYIGAANLLADTSKMRRLSPNLTFCTQTLASGHFPQVFVPDQINAMIERFVAMIEVPFPPER